MAPMLAARILVVVPLLSAALALGACATRATFHAAAGAAPRTEPPPEEVTIMLAEVSPERLRTDVDTLAAFGTRHTLSDTASDTRGIGASRRWIQREFQAIADASGRHGADTAAVVMDSHWVEPDGRRITRAVEVVNPMFILPGASAEARNRRVYVIGHYDSRNSGENDAEGDAPGANDDASGVAVVLELARIMSTRRFDCTVVFMATAGEEQGLVGARQHARKAREQGVEITAVLSNDIVGDPSSPDGADPFGGAIIRVFSEGLPIAADADQTRAIRALGAENDSPSRALARYVAETSAWHDLPVAPLLVFRPDRFLRGGDHTGFNEQGYAAVRFTEFSEDYDRQHQDVRVENGRQYGDLPEFVEPMYLAGVAQVNLAALAHLANAPGAPADARLVAATLGNTTTIRWNAPPDGDVAFYEVVTRATPAPFWQEVAARVGGSATEATLPFSKDNQHFGVRAVDQDGYRSLVAFPRAARE